MALTCKSMATKILVLDRQRFCAIAHREMLNHLDRNHITFVHRHHRTPRDNDTYILQCKFPVCHLMRNTQINDWAERVNARARARLRDDEWEARVRAAIRVRQARAQPFRRYLVADDLRLEELGRLAETGVYEVAVYEARGEPFLIYPEPVTWWLTNWRWRGRNNFARRMGWLDGR
jgi:hypothetical protein